MRYLLLALCVGCASTAGWTVKHSPAADMKRGMPLACFPDPPELLCFTLEEGNAILDEAQQKREQQELDSYPPKELKNL